MHILNFKNINVAKRNIYSRKLIGTLDSTSLRHVLVISVTLVQWAQLVYDVCFFGVRIVIDIDFSVLVCFGPLERLKHFFFSLAVNFFSSFFSHPNPFSYSPSSSASSPTSSSLFPAWYTPLLIRPDFYAVNTPLQPIQAVASFSIWHIMTLADPW